MIRVEKRFYEMLKLNGSEGFKRFPNRVEEKESSLRRYISILQAKTVHDESAKGEKAIDVDDLIDKDEDVVLNDKSSKKQTKFGEGSR